MGADRPQRVAELQGALMRAAGDFGCDGRLLATAAALDYVLMLATETSGVPIGHDDAERAIREGIVRAVDELLARAAEIVAGGRPQAAAFARETARIVGAVVRDEGLENDERRFAVIALANA